MVTKTQPLEARISCLTDNFDATLPSTSWLWTRFTPFDRRKFEPTTKAE